MPSAFFLVSDEGPAINTSGPTVGGIARDGETLTATPGSWQGTPTITTRTSGSAATPTAPNCVDIPGATGSSYTLDRRRRRPRRARDRDRDQRRGRRTARRPTATGSVTQEPPANTAAPTVSGTLESGQTLTSTLGTWDGTGPLDYTYQWQRCDGRRRELRRHRGRHRLLVHAHRRRRARHDPRSPSPATNEAGSRHGAFDGLERPSPPPRRPTRRSRRSPARPRTSAR